MSTSLCCQEPISPGPTKIATALLEPRALSSIGRQRVPLPLTPNLDNMKAAVLKADWFDPEINPKLADFCLALRHAHGVT
jgi:hypothetical protein